MCFNLRVTLVQFKHQSVHELTFATLSCRIQPLLFSENVFIHWLYFNPIHQNYPVSWSLPDITWFWWADNIIIWKPLSLVGSVLTGGERMSRCLQTPVAICWTLSRTPDRGAVCRGLTCKAPILWMKWF